MADKKPEKKSRVRINLGGSTPQPQPQQPEKKSRVRINLGGRKK